MDEWDFNLPIKYLDKRIRDYFVANADYLFDDLVANKLEVCLIPANPEKFSGHMIRAAFNQNPDWYRDLFWGYFPNFRRDRSLQSLNRIRKLNDKEFRASPYWYDSIYRELIFENLTRGFSCSYGFVYPEREVVDYFSFISQSVKINSPIAK